MANAWPKAIGTSAAKTAVLERFCSPRSTENSQPIPGFRPCQAPSRVKTNQGHAADNIYSRSSGVAGVTGVRSLDRKFLIEGRRVNRQSHAERRPPATP